MAQRESSRDSEDGGDTGYMKAVFLSEYVHALSEIKASLVPIPQISTTSIPAATAVATAGRSLVKVRVTHTSPTHVDTLYARGLHQNNHSGLVRPPFTLGLEFAGVVVQSSSGAGFKNGDRVWGSCLGSFAPYVVCPASSVRLVPDTMSLADVAGLGASTAPVSYGALIRIAELKKGETVLVHGAAGGLGVAAVSIARAVGANVIGTVGSDEKARVIQGMLDGCFHGNGVVRYDQDGWEKKVKDITGGKGVDVVFDTVGLVAKSIRCCRYGGRIVIVGFVGRGDGKNGKMEEVAMNKVLLKGVKLLGYRYGETSRQFPNETAELWNGFDKLLASRTVKPVIYRHYKGIESAPTALMDLASRKAYGKIVIEICDDDVQLSNRDTRVEKPPSLESSRLKQRL